MNSASASVPAPRTRAAPWVAVAIAAAGASVLAFRGAVPYFFAQDDFLGLARARGLAPALTGPWRWIPGQAYFTLMRPFGLASAAPYHIVSLTTHALTSALLAWLLARRAGPAAALAGATFFAAHPSLYTALYSVSGLGEILSGLFVVLTLLLADRPGRGRWLAPVTFACALSSKESVILLPFAMLISGGRFFGGGKSSVGSAGPPGATGGAARGGAPRRTVAVEWTLAALSAVMLAWLFAADVFGARTGLSSGAPYALSLGPHIFANLASYLGWAVQPWLPLARGFTDAVDSAVFPAAVLAALATIAALAWPRWRAAGGAGGAILFLALIAPVLPLPHHTYHYYLYAPMIGIAMCIAALFGAVEELAPPGVTSAVAFACATLFSLNGAAFVHEIETRPFTDPRLRADALVDRALIARRVRDGLAAAHIPDSAPVRFWSPWALLEQARAAGGAASANESYAETNVRAALMDGLAVRVLFPRLGEATFAHRYVSPPSGARVALYDADGSLRVLAPAQVDSMLAAHPIPGARP